MARRPLLNCLLTAGLAPALLSAPEAGRRAAASHLYAHLAQEAPFQRDCILTQWGLLTSLTPVRPNVFYQFDQWVLKK